PSRHPSRPPFVHQALALATHVLPAAGRAGVRTQADEGRGPGLAPTNARRQGRELTDRAGDLANEGGRFPTAPAGRRRRSNPLDRLLVVQLQVALVAPGVDLAPVDGVLDGAGGLVGVRAVGEAAGRHIRPELAEITLDLARLDAPELELAQAGRVHH